MTIDSALPKVKKIAIVNPYLIRGQNQISEVEACYRFIDAAKKLGIEVAVFNRSEEVHAFNPDFIIPITYQEPKLTEFPTYGLVVVPLNWATWLPRLMRNILTYDAYFTVAPIIKDWLNNISKVTGKVMHIENAMFSMSKTAFKPLDLNNATAVYMGVNWDGLRHHELFSLLSDGKFLKCYGPKGSWDKYPASLYGGSVPFDGFATLDTYAKHGIGLAINHPDADRDGVPACRIFEIIASSAVAICTDNAYYKSTLGDAVLYVDKTLSPNNLAEAIKEKVLWVRSHPKEAQALAKKAHDIFLKDLSLESFIEKMVEMHQRVVIENGFRKKTSPVKSPKITYIISVENAQTVKNIIADIQRQTYDNVDAILLVENQALEKQLKHYLNDKIHLLHYSGPSSNLELFNSLQNHGTEWISVLKNDDKLFPNHSALLMKSYLNSQHDKNNESTVIVFANSLEHSSSANLRDKLQDAHMLYSENNVRVGNLSPQGQIPFCAIAIKLTKSISDTFKSMDFRSNLNINFTVSPSPLELAIPSNEITCSSSVVDPLRGSFLTIKNMAWV